MSEHFKKAISLIQKDTRFFFSEFPSHPDYTQPYRFSLLHSFLFNSAPSAFSNLILEFSQTSLRHRYLDKGLPLRYEWHKLITYMLRRTRFIPIRFHPFLSICFTKRLYSLLRVKGTMQRFLSMIESPVISWTISLSDSQCIII